MDTIANVWPADNSGVSSHGPAARNRHATPWLAAPRRHLRSARRAAGGAFACRAAANNASAPSQRRLSSPPASGGGAAEASPLPLPLPRVVELPVGHGIPRGATLFSMQRWLRPPRRQPEGAAASAMHRWRPPPPWGRHLRRRPPPYALPLSTPHPTGAAAAAPGPRENKSILV